MPIFFRWESCDYRQVCAKWSDIRRVMTGCHKSPYYAAQRGRWLVLIWLVGIVTVAAAISVAFLPSRAKAAFMDGELLHRLCENSASEAAAYSIGIADSLQWIEDAQEDPENLDIRLCIPGTSALGKSKKQHVNT